MENLNEIVTLAKTGNEEALSDIVKMCKDIVYFKSRNYFIQGADKEDVFQEGMLGLLRAIKHYKNQSPFRSFASLCIERQLITAVKRANALKHSIVNNANMDILEFSIASTEQSPEESFLSKEELEMFSVFLKLNLSTFEFKVYGYLVKGYTYREISKKLNKSLKTTDNAIQRVRQKSSKFFNRTEKINE